MTPVRKAWNQTFRSLRVRNYRVYFISQLISVSGTWMQSIAQAWLVLRLTGSGVDLGIVTGLQFLPVLLFGPFGGLVADRFDKRHLLYATQTAGGLLALTLGILDVTHLVELWQVYLLATGLGVDIDRPTSEYSHGMGYRLGLAQALLGAPDLLLLDEPTTGMDPAQVLEVRSAIAERVAMGATVVLSSHHLAEVEEVCTHAAVLRRGRLVAEGPMEELVGGRDRVRLEVDDTDRAAAVLGSLPGVSAVERRGSGAGVAEGDSLRAVDLVDRLDAVGITVTALRPGTFEDTYLDLFEGGGDTPSAPFPTP